MDELKKQHDEYIANKPDSMSDEDYAALIDEHKEACPFCNENLIANIDPNEGGDMEKTFTQEELDAAVEAAVAPIKTELQTLKETAEQSEVDTRVAEAKAEGERLVAEIQEQLDAAVNEAGTAKKELDDLKTYLTATKEEAELAELYEAIKADRMEKIKEVANFKEEYINENIDRWAAKDQADFDGWLADIAMTAGTKVEDDGSISDEQLHDTAMQVVRPNVDTKTVTKGDLKSLFEAARSGVDLRKV